MKIRTLNRIIYNQRNNTGWNSRKIERHQREIKEIQDWLASCFYGNAVFFSLRWYTNPPTTDRQLISRLHRTFNKVFQKLSNSRWFKMFGRHLCFVVIRECGDSDEFHAHAVVGTKSDKFTADDIIKACKKAEPMMRMEVFEKKKNEEVKFEGRYDDNMVISKIYDKDGVAGYVSKEFDIKSNKFGSMDFAKTDNLIFDFEIFN